MIDQSEIVKTILCNLYLDYFGFSGTSNLPLLAGQGHWDERTASRIIEGLEERGLIRPFTLGGNYRITAAGIIEAENGGLVPADVLVQNQGLRMSVLRRLAELREERGMMAGLHFAELAEHESVSRECLAWNETFLQDIGLIEDFGPSSRITRDGLVFLQEQEQQAGIEAEFARIKDLQPRARGKALEQLMGRVAETQGWTVVTNVKTNNEEIDLVIRQGREYYVIECKWLKNPVEAEVVEKHFGKLAKRAGTHGILLSMSGFTGGANAAVTEHSHDRLILLFGPQDAADVILGRTDFGDLLTQKFDALVMYKRVEWQ